MYGAGGRKSPIGPKNLRRGRARLSIYRYVTAVHGAEEPGLEIWRVIYPTSRRCGKLVKDAQDIVGRVQSPSDLTVVGNRSLR